MSYIDKLSILGVRAFPIINGETIKFDKPLTLVAGINGSGKTTIIECLRFVTTGSLPPGASTRGAWIHDPGLEGEKEVLAQVRLAFHSANGTRLVANRSLMLDIKKGARSQKTREATLLLQRNGEKTTLSTRVAELDLQVPLYLGVSTSLLDNVLFCHQEDSQWPLAESGTLKKKFDEIFEAGKYTNAVKELVGIKKKHKTALGVLEEQSNSAAKEKTRAKRARKDMKDLNDKISQLREQSKKLQEDMDSVQHEAERAWTESENHSAEIGKLEQYRIDASSKEHILSDLKVHLKEVSETEEWLQRTLSEFSETLERYNEDRESKREQYLEYVDQIDEVKEQLDERLTEQGQYQQEKNAYLQQLEGRRVQIKESANKHQLRGFDDINDDAKVEEFFLKIKKLSKDRSSKLEQARAESDKQKAEAITTVNKLTQRQLALKDTRSSTSRQMAEYNRNASQKQTEADNINVDEGRKAAIETGIEDLQNRLLKLREASQSADYATKIRVANSDLSDLENEMSALTDEQIQASKRAGEIAQLAHVKQQLKQKDRGLDTLLKAHSERITLQIGDEWNPSTLEGIYKEAVSEAGKATTAAEQDRDALVRESEQIQFKLKTARNDLKKRKAQAIEHEEFVKKAIDGEVDDYEAELESTQQAVTEAQAAANNFGGLKDYFEKVLETAGSNHVCRLCERKFKDGSDKYLLAMQTKMRNLIEKSARSMNQDQLNLAVEDHKRVVEAGPSFENWRRLTKDEIPPLEQGTLELSKEQDKVSLKIERHDKTVDSKQTAQKELESVSVNVTSITKIEQDIRELTTKVEELTAKQSQHGELKTLEEIQEEMNTVKTKVQKARALVTSLTNEQSTATTDNYNLEIELRESKNDLASVSRQLDRKIAFLDRVQEFKDLSQKQRTIMEKLDTDIENLSPEIDTATAQRDDIEQRSNTTLRELNQEARSLDETVNALDLVNRSITSYIESGGESKLNRAVREVERLRQDMSKLEAARTQVTKEISKVEEQLRDSDNTRRHYADNLRYRQESRALKALRAEIEQLEDKNIEHDRDELLNKSQRLTKRHHQLAAERAGVVGEIKSTDLSLEKMIREYDTELKDATARFRKANTKFSAVKAAIEDISKYSTALDQAVTKYHTLKMEQVNSIMDELWRATYMGTDIDTIYIKSDLEVKANTRTHNYRVVMLKRDVELDMRGRCSAGQKVLASIIIRLALAECFSKDCGVIALDEPTTNLDEKNIESLALSLHKIIEARRHQENFQLIIITHDERFLELMDCTDFTDHYWRVSRNDKDDSVIEKQSILAVMRK